MRAEKRKRVVLFDGECHFCNYWVNWILRHDHDGEFQFASLQSIFANQLLDQPEELNSLVLVEDSKIFVRSTAVLRICKHLQFPWKLAYTFILFPVLFRDAVYNRIAQHRHQLYQKKEQCIVPSQETRERFLE